ncbi:hypothetical protein DICPUDRAFT_74595 [Dictyostelium purpureum]|uniref:RING-type E3 ubiquitin transferase n=1 Tax=Dictyostelium purpureum TaxID=5786 RepID=F0Z873_DICPU|nr:uncharacterized protein DICPUDRAFT_74595 [Dictyostelium purpureum]EGC39846.1 hypothetical protein DICPUDRAFT_74595 [Dictyostelium purpureum]|eukprot:XP_003283597.1 hypothetical protein DICPUDRAFT_74595 [Dictyostelium purpureum]
MTYKLKNIFLIFIIIHSNNSINSNELVYPRNLTFAYEAKWDLDKGVSYKLEGFGKNSGVVYYAIKNTQSFLKPTTAAGSSSINNTTQNSGNSSTTSGIVYRSYDMIEGNFKIRDGDYTNNNGIDGFVYGIYEYTIGLATMLILPYNNDEIIFNKPPSPINYELVENMTDTDAINNIKSQINNITLTNDPFTYFLMDKNISASSLDSIEIPFNPKNQVMLTFIQQFQQITEKENQAIINTFEAGQTNENLNVLIKANGTLSSSFMEFSFNVYGGGFNVPRFRSKWMNYVVLVSLSSFIQIFVLIRQIDYTSTQTAAARVSIYSIGLQTILDAYLCLIHLSAGVIIDSLFNAFATASFFQFITFALFEMRYLLIILKARSPSAFSDGWESLRREISIFYLRFYTCLFGGFILLYYFSGLFSLFLFIMYSYWVPQIYANAKNGIRKPFIWRYVLGISITRLAIPLYFYGCPTNYITQPNYYYSSILVLWTALQVSILYAQYKFGPQFFIPARFLPQRYNYYRPINNTIRSREEGQGCVICMSDVEEGQKYMLTQCNHLFHEKCLVSWMEYKLQCPTCRCALEPIDIVIE